MKKIAFDIKDGYAAIVTGGDLEPEFIMIGFDEADFADDSENESSVPKNLFALGDERLASLYSLADQALLAVPMRFSLVKSLSIDQAAVEKYGSDFLQWEAKQQLPDELGQFISGFSKLGESYDGLFGNYLYYAVPRDFIEGLLNFAVPDTEKKPALSSEALGLFNVINLAMNQNGFGAAISLEHDGASIALSHDGVFLGGRFIAGEKPTLGDEIKYYIMGHAPEDLRPNVLICGDMNKIDSIGAVTWAEILKIPDSLKTAVKSGKASPELFTAAAGLIMQP